MNWLKRARTKAQQAPTSTPSFGRQALRSLPSQTASRMANWTKLLAITQMMYRPMKVRMAFHQLENRFSRIQPSTPVVAGGGGFGGSISVR